MSEIVKIVQKKTKICKKKKNGPALHTAAATFHSSCSCISSWSIKTCKAYFWRRENYVNKFWSYRIKNLINLTFSSTAVHTAAATFHSSSISSPPIQSLTQSQFLKNIPILLIPILTNLNYDKSRFLKIYTSVLLLLHFLSCPHSPKFNSIEKEKKTSRSQTKEFCVEKWQKIAITLHFLIYVACVCDPRDKIYGQDKICSPFLYD